MRHFGELDSGGSRKSFSLPSNPHAASFFLTEEQMNYWMNQPTFDDEDNSWIGPLESAATLSVRRVFDIYKPIQPDPFFLEVQHFGARYACQFQRDGDRYGGPPILAIAQNAVGVALETSRASPGDNDNWSSQFVRKCLAVGTAARYVVDWIGSLVNWRNVKATSRRSATSTRRWPN